MSKDHMPRVLTQDIGDVDLSYLLYEGEGPTIVLLHATGFLPWLWHPIARELAPRVACYCTLFLRSSEVRP